MSRKRPKRQKWRMRRNDVLHVEGPATIAVSRRVTLTIKAGTWKPKTGGA